MNEEEVSTPPFHSDSAMSTTGGGADTESSDSGFKVGKMKIDFKNDDDRKKKRQVRLEKNRKSAALSRHRKKEYISNLEQKAQELRANTQEITLQFTQISNANMETLSRLEKLDEQLNTILSENDILKKRIVQIQQSHNQHQQHHHHHHQNNSTTTAPVITHRNSISSTTQSDRKKDSTDIVIGANKFNNSKSNESNNVQSPTSLIGNSSDIEFSVIHYKPTNIFNNLSISNPNVNSNPIYLTRARSSSYHPSSNNNLLNSPTIMVNSSANTSQTTNIGNNNNNSQSNTMSETLIAEALTNLSKDSPVNNSSESSPILPSLSLITKNLVGCSPSPSSPLSSISSPLGCLSLSPIQSPVISHSRAKKNPSLLVNVSTLTTAAQSLNN